MDRVWPGTSVAEATLAQNIFALRKALGDPPHIETVPKFGYRFVAPMRERPAAPRKAVLVVLPLENLSGDAEQEYFSDGLTDELITQLGRLNPDRARHHRAHLGDEIQADQENGRRRSDGSWASPTSSAGTRAPGRPSACVCTARLVQVADQTHLWGESYEPRLRRHPDPAERHRACHRARDQNPADARRGHARGRAGRRRLRRTRRT